MTAQEWQPGKAEVDAAAKAMHRLEADDPGEFANYADLARAALIAAHAVVADLLPVQADDALAGDA